MTSLYNRATPSQFRLLRIIEGAVKNTTDAHPELNIGPHHRRSIAKRAVGTLSAQWADVLAARPSDGDGAQAASGVRGSHFSKVRARGASHFERRSPLAKLRSKIAYQMKGIKAAGNTERAQAMIDILRMIAELSAQPSNSESRREG